MKGVSESLKNKYFNALVKAGVLEKTLPEIEKIRNKEYNKALEITQKAYDIKSNAYKDAYNIKHELLSLDLKDRANMIRKLENEALKIKDSAQKEKFDNEIKLLKNKYKALEDILKNKNASKAEIEKVKNDYNNKARDLDSLYIKKIQTDANKRLQRELAETKRKLRQDNAPKEVVSELNKLGRNLNKNTKNIIDNVDKSKDVTINQVAHDTSTLHLKDDKLRDDIKKYQSNIDDLRLSLNKKNVGDSKKDDIKKQIEINNDLLNKLRKLYAIHDGNTDNISKHLKNFNIVKTVKANKAVVNSQEQDLNAIKNYNNSIEKIGDQDKKYKKEKKDKSKKFTKVSKPRNESDKKDEMDVSPNRFVNTMKVVADNIVDKSLREHKSNNKRTADKITENINRNYEVGPLSLTPKIRESLRSISETRKASAERKKEDFEQKQKQHHEGLLKLSNIIKSGDQLNEASDKIEKSIKNDKKIHEEANKVNKELEDKLQKAKQLVDEVETEKSDGSMNISDPIPHDADEAVNLGAPPIKYPLHHEYTSIKFFPEELKAVKKFRDGGHEMIIEAKDKDEQGEDHPTKLELLKLKDAWDEESRKMSEDDDKKRMEEIDRQYPNINDDGMETYTI